MKLLILNYQSRTGGKPGQNLKTTKRAIVEYGVNLTGKATRANGFNQAAAFLSHFDLHTIDYRVRGSWLKTRPCLFHGNINSVQFEDGVYGPESAGIAGPQMHP